MLLLHENYNMVGMFVGMFIGIVDDIQRNKITSALIYQQLKYRN